MTNVEKRKAVRETKIPMTACWSRFALRCRDTKATTMQQIARTIVEDHPTGTKEIIVIDPTLAAIDISAEVSAIKASAIFA